MKLITLCKKREDYIFTYKINSKYHLWFMAQTTIDDIDCDMEDNGKFEPDKITHFIVELWTSGENGDMIDNLGVWDKDLSIGEYVRIAKNYITKMEESERIIDRDRALSIINSILSWGNEHNQEFRECLIHAMHLSEEEIKELRLEDYTECD